MALNAEEKCFLQRNSRDARPREHGKHCTHIVSFDPPTSQLGQNCYYSHVVEEETEAQGGEVPQQRPSQQQDGVQTPPELEPLDDYCLFSGKALFPKTLGCDHVL